MGHVEDDSAVATTPAAAAPATKPTLPEDQFEEFISAVRTVQTTLVGFAQKWATVADQYDLSPEQRQRADAAFLEVNEAMDAGDGEVEVQEMWDIDPSRASRARLQEQPVVFGDNDGE